MIALIGGFFQGYRVFCIRREMSKNIFTPDCDLSLTKVAIGGFG